MRSSSRGFTLIELLVVTSILVLLTSMILVNNSRFGGKILLENLAYDIGLSVRQAQVYGISVRKLGPGTYGTPYGIHVDRSSSDMYVLFADINGDGLYQDDELVSRTSIERGFRISELCATSPTGVEDCSATQLTILFARPEPDAWIGVNDTACTPQGGVCMESGRIRLMAPRGDLASVQIHVNGQISVDTH